MDEQTQKEYMQVIENMSEGFDSTLILHEIIKRNPAVFNDAFSKIYGPSVLGERISNDTMKKLTDLIKGNQTIKAIQELRTDNNIELKHAKLIIDHISNCLDTSKIIDS